MRIGFIGLGRMGSNMVRRLLRDGHEVVAWNRSPEKTREIVTRPGTPKERRFNGQDYLLGYGLPQFFFHVTTAYALLRHNGVDVGKRDYMGAY